MTAFSVHAFLTQHEDSTEQIRALQLTIHENTCKLAEVQQAGLSAAEEIVKLKEETKQRVEMMMQKSEVLEVLQEYGHLLQQEKLISEQLRDQDSPNRNLNRDLQERSERFTTKVKSLTAEIVEVKLHLEQAKARNMAAQALIHAPTSKRKKNQNKRK